MADERASLRALLDAWRGGDESALNAILQRYHDWLHQYVRSRMGAHLRRQAESMDVVQEAALEVLRYGPQFVVSSEDDFRALLGRIVENNLRDRGRRMNAARRDSGREQAYTQGMSVDLDAPSVSTPSMQMSRRENEEWMRLAVELMDPDERDVVVMRQSDGMQWEEIGEALGIGKSAARMRFERALPKLALKIQKLKNGRIGELLKDAG
jgi:RNA polymerase sigma-70 factor (ECF subfamily)